jgi:hypothetical protein
MVSKEIVFIAVLSRFAAMAIFFESSATRILILLSRWETRLYSCRMLDK